MNEKKMCGKCHFMLCYWLSVGCLMNVFVSITVYCVYIFDVAASWIHKEFECNLSVQNDWFSNSGNMLVFVQGRDEERDRETHNICA